MSFEPRNLRALGNRVEVPLQVDENGHLGRECPVPECEGYFLVKPGTGLTGDNLPRRCPYCGHSGTSNTFFTKEQVEYARSVVLRKVTDALRKDLKTLEFNHRPRGPFGIGISLKLQPGQPLPIRHYREKKLETFVTCAHCSLEYGVYGVFAYCPDCGEHNSAQMLERNLDLTRRQVNLAESVQDADMARHLIEDALENCVSALDGLGREAVRVRAGKATEPAACGGLSFQNLEKAHESLSRLFRFNLKASVPAAIWETAHRGFMKRHLIAHRAGVVDKAYIDQTGDSSAVIGRRVQLNGSEVRGVIAAVEALGRALHGGLPRP